jgi:hypothetical protein
MQKIDTGSKISSGSEKELSLGFMLFNIQTLLVFDKILNDSNAQLMKQLDPLVRLIKNLVRILGETSRKNHLLFVEMLLQHAHAQTFCEIIDSVYDARSYISQPNTHLGAHDDDSETGSIVSDRESEASDFAARKNDYGDEYDENEDLPAAFNTAPKKDKKKRDKKTKVVRKPKYNSDGESNTDWDSDSERRIRSKVLKWTDAEDKELREQYDLYANSRGVFDILAQNEFLRYRLLLTFTTFLFCIITRF